MLFNTLTYWIFLAIVFFVYWWLNKLQKINLRNLFVLIASYYFYGSWDERFLLLIVASSAIDFVCGKKIFAAKTNRQRKVYLIISLVANIGMLGYFKYCNFFIDSFADFVSLMGLQPNKTSLSIILPVGISFYTFQTLSYSIDIYKGNLKPVSNPLTFFTFVAFFPQLVAGPIERAANLLPQLEKENKFSNDMAVSGLRFILWGLFKKMVIADRLSFVVDKVYGDVANYSGMALFISTIFFGIQIYCDFSGYSDIAIGSLRLLGIRLMDNFRTPYFSTTLQEFWQRWHISLSTWFRDYVYIPLGGNRKGKFRADVNLLVTFVVSGLWHGANYTFIMWGFLHGAFMVLERIFKNKWMKVSATIRMILVFVVANLFWIFFRAKNIHEAFSIFGRIFSLNDGTKQLLDLLSNDYKTYGISLLIGGGLFLIIEILIGKRDCDAFFGGVNKPVRIALYYLILAMIFVFGVLDTAPQFIYFQF